MRLKAVTNIQKITKSMKMISAAKYAKAERELKPARSYGVGAQGKLQIISVHTSYHACYSLTLLALVAFSLSPRGLVLFIRGLLSV